MSLYGEPRRQALTGKTIVLDLDQTLVATQDDYEVFNNSVSNRDTLAATTHRISMLKSRSYVRHVDDTEERGRGITYNFWGVVRPHTSRFLRFCFSYYKYVIVWSAGKSSYVEAIVQWLFRGLPAPHFVLTFDHTTITDEGVIIKPLRYLVNHGRLMGYNIELSSIMALDDNITTFSENPENGFLIAPYEPTDLLADDRDDVLEKFMLWLMKQRVIDAPTVGEISRHDLRLV
jgi:hypothetical protein